MLSVSFQISICYCKLRHFYIHKIPSYSKMFLQYFRSVCCLTDLTYQLPYHNKSDMLNSFPVKVWQHVLLRFLLSLLYQLQNTGKFHKGSPVSHIHWNCSPNTYHLYLFDLHHIHIGWSHNLPKHCSLPVPNRSCPDANLHQFPAVLHWLVSLHPRLCMLSEIS